MGKNKSRLAPPQLDIKQLQVFDFDVVTVEVKSVLFGLGSKIKLNRRHSQAQYFTEYLGNGVTLDMVEIPGTTFMMGSPEDTGYEDEKPQHLVKVQPFFIGKYPITQAQWRAIASLPKIAFDLEPDPSKFKGDDRPVEEISWDEAVEFCQRLSKKTGKQYRLPSEAEWEYACRAGTTTPFYCGETITDKLANYRASETYANGLKGKCREQTTPVGSFPPNAFGLYDMHGNIWEWCADTWHDNYEGVADDSSVWSSEESKQKVIRGGSWDDNPRYCRSGYRYFGTRNFRSFLFGLRVVCIASRTTEHFALLSSPLLTLTI